MMKTPLWSFVIEIYGDFLVHLNKKTFALREEEKTSLNDLAASRLKLRSMTIWKQLSAMLFRGKKIQQHCKYVTAKL